MIQLNELILSDYINISKFNSGDYNSKSGLYFIYNNDKELMYIGKAKHIGGRILQHKVNEEVGMYYSFFRYVELDCPVDRDIYETYYINKLKPPLNREKVFLYTSKYEELRYKSKEELEDNKRLESEYEYALKNFRR